MIFHVLLTLEDDVVLSASTASAGAHRSLDYVPGSALLGVAARALYRAFGDEAWAAFHAGAAIFGDGLPMSDDGSIGYPAPLSLHYPKGTARDSIIAETFNRAVDAAERGQLEQWRNRHLTLAFAPVDVKKSYRLRTAIDETTDRARTGQLFGYEAIARGARFIARIELDETRLAMAHCDRLRELFSSEIRLGRSRSTEYGRVSCEISTDIADEVIGAASSSDRIRYWAISDLALCDEDGFPTVTPSASAFGLTEADAQIDWTRTFLRTRRYAPFNAALGAHLREREVIERGSVITFRIRPDAAAAGGESRVGRHREIGLGRVVVNPALLSATKPVSAIASPIRGKLAVVTARAPSQEPFFLRWAKKSLPRPASEIEDWAQKKYAELESLYETARRIGGENERGYSGPSPAQWGRVITLVGDIRVRRSAAPWSDLEVGLFGVDGEPANKSKAIAKDGDEDWGRIGSGPKAQQISFREWFRTAIETRPEKLEIDAVARLAKSIKERLVENNRPGRRSA